MTSRARRAPVAGAAEPQLGTVDGLAQLSFLVHGNLAARASKHELSLIQTRLLGVLRDRNPSMNELAALLQLDKSSTSGLVARAERRGLVERVPSTADRRAVQVGLTAQGRALVAHVADGFAGDVLAMVAVLSPTDRQTLTRLISQVLVAHAAERGIDLFATTDAAGG